MRRLGGLLIGISFNVDIVKIIKNNYVDNEKSWGGVLRKIFFCLSLLLSSVISGADQRAYDVDDGIHDPNSTKLAYSIYKKAVKDSGSSCPTALDLERAREALAQKPGTLVYKYEQEMKTTENKGAK